MCLKNVCAWWFVYEGLCVVVWRGKGVALGSFSSFFYTYVASML